MELSTGVEFTFGNDSDGPALIVTGNADVHVVVPGNVWTKTAEHDDGSRVWRLQTGSSLGRIEKPVDDNGRELIEQKISDIPLSGLHPALKNGLDGEINRLYPGISDGANSAFKEFVTFLGTEFGVTQDTWADEPLVPYVNDIGPQLMVVVDEQIEILPEIPLIYEAPQAWNRAMWWVHNNMFGPITWDEIEDIDRIVFGGITIPEDAKTPIMEGLIYYQAARAVVFGDAQQNEPDAPFLNVIIDTVMKKGIRPWQNPRNE
jgi:hypothetical protein